MPRDEEPRIERRYRRPVLWVGEHGYLAGLMKAVRERVREGTVADGQATRLRPQRYRRNRQSRAHLAVVAACL